MMTPKVSSTYQQATYDKIYSMFVRGKLHPREMLSRRRLADQLGVSPGSVQHVLGRLEGAGLVERRPQSGTYLRLLSTEEIEQAYDVRELIEPYLTRRASTRTTPTQVRKLRKSCQEMTRYASRLSSTTEGPALGRLVSGMIEQEHNFHGTIAAAAQNTQAAQVIGHLGILLRLAVLDECASRRNFLHRSNITAIEHQQIYEAIAARNSDLAEELMRAHIEEGRVQRDS